MPGATPIALASTIVSCQRVARQGSRLGVPPLFGSDVVNGLRTTFPIPITGRPLELRPVLQLVDAVLIAWHPGSESGPALADVLLGARAPAVRLPMNLRR